MVFRPDPRLKRIPGPAISGRIGIPSYANAEPQPLWPMQPLGVLDAAGGAAFPGHSELHQSCTKACTKLRLGSMHSRSPCIIPPSNINNKKGQVSRSSNSLTPSILALQHNGCRPKWEPIKQSGPNSLPRSPLTQLPLPSLLFLPGTNVPNPSPSNDDFNPARELRPRTIQ